MKNLTEEQFRSIRPGKLSAAGLESYATEQIRRARAKHIVNRMIKVVKRAGKTLSQWFVKTSQTEAQPYNPVDGLGANRFIDARKDFTEKDQAMLNWLRKKEAMSIRDELIRAAHETTKQAVKDDIFTVVVMTFIVTVGFVAWVIWFA